jgi:hypothetical protein
MRYHLINTLGHLADPSLCIIDQTPAGLGVKYFYMMEGKVIGDSYPANAAIRMSDKYEGTKLSSFLGNTESYLIGSKMVKEMIQTHYQGDIEYLPFTLYSPRGAVHSLDYFIINPIGTFDCLDLKSCDIKYLPNKNKIVKIRKFVLDAKKVEDAPPLFRIHEDPTEYVINDTLLSAFQEAGCTNLVVKELEQVGGAVAT